MNNFNIFNSNNFFTDKKISMNLFLNFVQSIVPFHILFLLGKVIADYFQEEDMRQTELSE